MLVLWLHFFSSREHNAQQQHVYMPSARLKELDFSVAPKQRQQEVLGCRVSKRWWDLTYLRLQSWQCRARREPVCCQNFLSRLLAICPVATAVVRASITPAFLCKPSP